MTTKKSTATKAVKETATRFRIYTKDYNYKFNASSWTDAVKKAIDRQIWLENITHVASYGEGPNYISKTPLKVTEALKAYEAFVRKEVKGGNKNYVNRYLVKPANKAKAKAEAKPKAKQEAKPKAPKAPKVIKKAEQPAAQETAPAAAE